jgi:hypothetical protein
LIAWLQVNRYPLDGRDFDGGTRRPSATNHRRNARAIRIRRASAPRRPAARSSAIPTWTGSAASGSRPRPIATPRRSA